MKRIGILLSGKMSFSALHTDDVREQAHRTGYEVEYLLDSTSGDASHITFDGHRLRNHLGQSRLYQLLRLIRRFSVQNESTEIKFREFIGEDLFRHRSLSGILAGYLAMAMAARVPGAGAICRALEKAFFPSTVFAETAGCGRYDIALLSSVGNFGFEAECLFARECVRAGIKTVSVVTNYDNFLNRGYAGFIPTRLGVWSDYMADNAMRTGIPGSRIEVIGAPSLDPLLRVPGLSRAEFLRGIGLDPNRKTILYAGGVLVGQSFEVIQAFVKSGMIGKYNFIFRPYPHSKVFSSQISALIASYLASQQYVYVSDAETLSNTIDASLGGFDLRPGSIADAKPTQIRYSDVVVNHFSTLGLEACVLNIPVVQVAFDAGVYGVKRSAHPSINCGQAHNLAQIRAHAAGIARSESDLLRMVEDYLADKLKDSEQRSTYVKMECGVLDGKSTARMFDLISAV